MEPRRLLVVEDLSDARAWLCAAIAEAFPDATVDLAADLAEARACVQRAVPDLLLVDLGLPDGSGIELIEQMAREAPHAVSVVTTVFADDQHLFAALRAGASGYVLKDDTRQRLGELLRGILRGEPPLSAQIARRLLGFFHPPANVVEDPLTDREREVLTLLAKGLTIAKAAQLMGISVNTAGGYAKNVYKKLKVSNRAEATLEATRRGLVNL